MNKFFFFFFILLVNFGYAVEERDWMHDWSTKELAGTEHLSPIDPKHIDQHLITITYSLDGGRFGDQLINYIKTLWVSWKYSIPLLYRAFDYSDQLKLSSSHSLTWNEETVHRFSSKIELARDVKKSADFFNELETRQTNTSLERRGHILGVIGVLTPFFEEWEDEKFDDEQFHKLLKEMICPNFPLHLPELPKEHLTVAIHVRTGKGYDWQVNIDNMPTKFPPDTFYLNGLKQISQFFSHRTLYVKIFTDDPNPQDICERFQNQLKSWGIANVAQLEYCRNQNRHDENVLLDFFSMAQFDCLIRPDSYFSRCVGLLGAHIIEIKPIRWGEYRKTPEGLPIKDKFGKLIIDCQMILRDEKHKTILKRQIALIDSSMLF